MYITGQLLTSLPTSIGDLSSLTTLVINNCHKLEYIPDSLGRLNLLSSLRIEYSGVKSIPKSVGQLINLQTLSIQDNPISELDLGAGLFTCLEKINLWSTEVSKISMPEDCHLERLILEYNRHLKDIEVLPNTLKSIVLEASPKLDVLPSFARLTFLRELLLKRCYGVKSIQGLEHCRALETLTAHTRWEEAGIESLERMERLRKVELKATSRSGVDCCIQSMQDLPKWPKEQIRICTRAIPDAATLVNSFDFSNLSVVDSFANQKMNHYLFLKWPSTASCILLCFVVNCRAPKNSLESNYSHAIGGSSWAGNSMELEEGKWVWIALLTQHSKFYKRISVDTKPLLSISSYRSEEVEEREVEKAEVEKGFLAMGEEEKVWEAFTRLYVLLSY